MDDRSDRWGLPRVLDPCSGSRMMWFDRAHPDVIFGDRRRETLTVTDHSHGNASGTRTICIDPDTLLDFRALPYAEGTFALVAFDPPHLVRAGPRSWLAAKYGKLGDDWRNDLRQGIRRVLPRVGQRRRARVQVERDTGEAARGAGADASCAAVRQHQRQEGRHALDGVHEAEGDRRCLTTARCWRPPRDRRPERRPPVQPMLAPGRVPDTAGVRAR